MKTKIAIVGRPNVGKSTLFNRIAKKKIAITLREPGITRDIIEERCEWRGKEFILMDTGGYVPEPSDPLSEKVLKQVRIAIEKADKIIFVVDAKQGLHPVDKTVADVLRKSGKEIFLAINKMDSKISKYNIWEFESLGIKEKFPISAEHGRGVEELLDALLKEVKKEEKKKEKRERINIIIVGRPNVGKSTLLNAIIGEERIIVDELPGTTRDPIKVEKEKEDMLFSLVDTPGIKRKSKIKDIVEYISTKRVEKQLKDTSVSLVLIDATQGITHLEKTIIGWLLEQGKGVVVTLNKCDKLKKREIIKIKEITRYELPFIKNIPIVPISALARQGLDKLEKEIEDVYHERKKRIQPGVLNEIFENIVSSYPPKRGVKVKGIRQIGTAPPRFVVYVSKTKRIENSYHRYLKNRLYDYFGFKGVDIKIEFKKG